MEELQMTSNTSTALITGGTRPCGLRPQFPPCAVQRYFGRCAYPISCDCATRLNVFMPRGSSSLITEPRLKHSTAHRLQLHLSLTKRRPGSLCTSFWRIQGQGYILKRLTAEC